MCARIEEAIYQDKFKVYKQYRAAFNQSIEDLRKDRIKIKHRKKTRKYIEKRCAKNSLEKFKLIATAVNQTCKHYR